MSLLETSESFLFLFSFNNNDNKYAVHEAKKCVEISIIVIYQSVLSTASPNPGVSTTVSLSRTPPSFISIVEGFIYMKQKKSMTHLLQLLLLIEKLNQLTDMCHMNFIIDLTHHKVSMAQW